MIFAKSTTVPCNAIIMLMILICPFSLAYSNTKDVTRESQWASHGQTTFKQRYFSVYNVVSTSFDHDVPARMPLYKKEILWSLYVTANYTLDGILRMRKICTPSDWFSQKFKRSRKLFNILWDHENSKKGKCFYVA